MARPLYCANWKMFHSLETAEAWLDGWQLHAGALPAEACVVVCPPAPLVYPLYAEIQRRGLLGLAVGGQTLNSEFKGAYTGEISGVSLWSVGAKWVIVGHSERRKYCGETDYYIARKMQQAFLCGLVPILCVGETQEQREAGETIAVLTAQLEATLTEVDEATLRNRQADPALPPLAIAYEPVWAIGAGRPATPALAEEVLEVLSHWLAQRFPEDLAGQIPLLYGGSVAPENIAGFSAQAHCHGALVGSASLEPVTFHQIVANGLTGQGYQVAAAASANPAGA